MIWQLSTGGMVGKDNILTCDAFFAVSILVVV